MLSWTENRKLSFTPTDPATAQRRTSFREAIHKAAAEGKHYSRCLESIDGTDLTIASTPASTTPADTPSPSPRLATRQPDTMHRSRYADPAAVEDGGAIRRMAEAAARDKRIADIAARHEARRKENMSPASSTVNSPKAQQTESGQQRADLQLDPYAKEREFYAKEREARAKERDAQAKAEQEKHTRTAVRDRKASEAARETERKRTEAQRADDERKERIRIEAEHHERVRLEQQKARLLQQQEHDRLERERLEQQKALLLKQQEAGRLAQARKEWEDAECRERERLEQEKARLIEQQKKAERERVEQEKAGLIEQQKEAERKRQEEVKRIEYERIEKEKQRLEAERKQQEEAKRIQRERLEKEKQRLEEEKQRLAKEREEAKRREVERLELEHQELEQAAREYQEKLKTLKDQESGVLDVLEDRRVTTENAVKSAAAEIEELTAKVVQLRNAHHAAQSELDKIKNEVDQTKRNFKSKREELKLAAEQAKEQLKARAQANKAAPVKKEDGSPKSIPTPPSSSPHPATPKKPADHSSAVATPTSKTTPAAYKSDGVDRKAVKTDGELRFPAWPQAQARSGGRAQVRRVKLTNLPSDSSFATIQSLIWGGRLEEIDYIPGRNSAYVRFMRGEDCKKYIDATGNGIDLPNDKGRIIWVEVMEDAEPVGELLKGYYDAGVTRCVRAIGIDDDWGEGGLTRLGASKKRKLERITNGKSQSGVSTHYINLHIWTWLTMSKARTVEWRFANIRDALQFKGELVRDIDFEHCNILYAKDPCEKYEKVHTGVD